jgi:hypothetical protein
MRNQENLNLPNVQCSMQLVVPRFTTSIAKHVSQVSHFSKCVAYGTLFHKLQQFMAYGNEFHMEINFTS